MINRVVFQTNRTPVFLTLEAARLWLDYNLTFDQIIQQVLLQHRNLCKRTENRSQVTKPASYRVSSL